MLTAEGQHLICPPNMGYILYYRVILAFRVFFLPEKRVLQEMICFPYDVNKYCSLYCSSGPYVNPSNLEWLFPLVGSSASLIYSTGTFMKDVCVILQGPDTAHSYLQTRCCRGCLHLIILCENIFNKPSF